MVKSYQLNIKSVTCPVCNSRSGQLLWSVNSHQAAQHFVLIEKDPKRFLELASHIENLWGQTICEVVRCNNCQFCFSNPFVGGDKQFYDLAYDRFKYPHWKWEHKRAYDILHGIASPDLHLLEVGAGDGSFIKRIVPHIFSKKQILCTEFSDYGRKRIQEFGIECLSDDVRNLNKFEFRGLFNFVCMFQMLEHMDNLISLFSKLHWLMQEEANLFISVPNPLRIQFYELNGALLDMPPNHVGRWNRMCFEEIARRTGFHLECYEIEPLNFLSMTKQFMKYRFLRKSQDGKSLANRITKVKQKNLRLPLQAMGAAVELLMSFSILGRIEKTMGNSLWVHLKKKRN